MQSIHAVPPYSDGRLHARIPPDGSLTPHPPAPMEGGTHRLKFPDGREARLHVPPDTDGRPLRLLVLLHGAGGQHGGADSLALAHAARHGTLLLIPDALGSSWDLLRGGYGPDLSFIDRALLWVMRHHAVDAERISIGGFSDGASYALSVGLMNGDLFSDILAFSPGFMAPLRRVGQPRVFVSHGQGDKVLSVERAHAIAEHLANDGYDVLYEEFNGGHIVEPAIARAALRRLAER
jgi:predicted esterase